MSSASTKRRHERNAELVAAWTHPIGTRVVVERSNGETLETVTESESFLLDGAHAMICVRGIPGNTKLSRVTRLPDVERKPSATEHADAGQRMDGHGDAQDGRECPLARKCRSRTAHGGRVLPARDEGDGAMSDRVCNMRADSGHCSCATGCAAKQLEEMREARDRAEQNSKRLMSGIQRVRNLLLYPAMTEAAEREEVLHVLLALVEGRDA